MKEIIDILTKFQKGYEDKKPEEASALVAEIFSGRQDLLTLGASSGELCIGRDEVTKLIHDDWDGGWGDFTIDIAGAKIEADGDAAWFYADCTVKYSFEDSNNQKYIRWVDWVKKIAESPKATPKQRLSFLNWALGLHYHERKSGKREYLWPSELSGMLVKENGAWKIAALHFATVKPDYPDERLEETIEDYHAYHNKTRDKIIAHDGNDADSKFLDFLKQLENEQADDVEWDSLCFDSKQVLVFDAGRFAWIMALGFAKQTASEDEIFNKSLKEIGTLFNSDLSPGDMLFQAKRNIAYALKETASGAEFTWPIRMTAVVEKAEGGYKFRYKHFSYPFNWIIEGKL